MFSFLGLRKDSKKSTTEKEVDGGFVIIGENKHKLYTMRACLRDDLTLYINKGFTIMDFFFRANTVSVFITLSQ